MQHFPDQSLHAPLPGVARLAVSIFKRCLVALCLELSGNAI